MTIQWYWRVRGDHTHVRVFCNGARCGELVFRNEEFAYFNAHITPQNLVRVSIEFIEEK